MPASAFEVRVTSYIASPREGPYARWQKEEGRVRLPAFLEPRDTEAEIPAGATRQFWLTLRVPDDAMPGLYRGTVTLTARGLAAPLKLPLEAEVYPFRLAEARPDEVVVMPSVPRSFRGGRRLVYGSDRNRSFHGGCTPTHPFVEHVLRTSQAAQAENLTDTDCFLRRS